MASEDPINALSPGIGHQAEEDGTIIQDHTAPIVVSDLMGRLFDQFLTVYTEGGKKEENKESVTILDERFVGCNGKKGEPTENESNSIDDYTVEQGTGWAREEAKDYNENEVEVSLVKTERFKNEVQSRRIAMEDEVQRRILDSLVNCFLREEEMVDNENKEEEEEEEEEDKYSLHREFLLSLENWDGGKGKKIDNENVGSLAETESFKNEDCKLNEANLIDDHIVEQGTGWAREFSFVESEVQSRRIAREAEAQRRLLDSMVNLFLREEELVDNENKEEEDDKYSLHMEILLSLDNGNVASLAETESFKKEQVEEIPKEMDAELLADYLKWCGIAQQDPNDLVLENVAVREEEKVDNGDEFEDQRRLLHSLVNWFLCKETNFDFHKEKEEEDKDILHRKILLSLGNWHGCKEEKVDNVNEEMEGRIATDDYSVEKGDNEEDEEEDGVSLQRRIPDSIVNFHGCENENEVSLAETESFKKEEEDASMLSFKKEQVEEIPKEMDAELLADYQKWCGIAQQDPNDLVLENVAVREEKKADNGNEFEDQRRLLHSLVNWFLCKETNFHKEKEEEDKDILHRKILLSLGNWHGCKEEKVDNVNEEMEGRIATDDYSVEKGDNEEDEEEDGVSLQKRIPDSIVNFHGCENENEVSLAETESFKKEEEDASMLNQITEDLDDIEFIPTNENDARAPGMIRDANSEEGGESPESGEMEATTENPQENEVKERINCCCCS